MTRHKAAGQTLVAGELREALRELPYMTPVEVGGEPVYLVETGAVSYTHLPEPPGPGGDSHPRPHRPPRCPAQPVGGRRRQAVAAAPGHRRRDPPCGRHPMRTRRYYAVRTAVRWAIWGPVGIGVYLLICIDSPLTH